jgi:OOP family OmpA-OmpF porin
MGQTMVQKAAEEFRSGGNRLVLFVTGYSDMAGSRPKNIVISHHRAEAVAKALTQMGVPSDRITVRGLGPENPVADNQTHEGRLKNRRVEIEFVEAQN